MKYYNVEVITYNEDEYKKIITLINENYKWCSAYHDKDVKEDTGEVKPHYHIQIYGNIQKSLKSWAKHLEVDINKIEIIKYKKQAIQYLIHKNQKNKYQYEKEIIRSNFDIEEYFEEKIDETSQLKMIIEYIKQTPLIKMKELLEFALENKVWTTYRRNYTIIKDYIIERNNLTKERVFDKI